MPAHRAGEFRALLDDSAFQRVGSSDLGLQFRVEMIVVAAPLSPLEVEMVGHLMVKAGTTAYSLGLRIRNSGKVQHDYDMNNNFTAKGTQYGRIEKIPKKVDSTMMMGDRVIHLHQEYIIGHGLQSRYSLPPPWPLCCASDMCWTFSMWFHSMHTALLSGRFLGEVSVMRAG